VATFKLLWFIAPELKTMCECENYETIENYVNLVSCKLSKIDFLDQLMWAILV